SLDDFSSLGASTTPVLDGADSIGTDVNALEALAAKVFGIEAFRDMQREAIQACLDDRDLFLVLPTGGGKSLCFQAPALVRPGLTLVISPLISLMKDQVDGLVQNGVPAGMLTSAQTAEDKREVNRQLRAGGLKLLYVAPERLFVPGFLEGLLRGPGGIAAIAIDEAHCISQWGHDFRPEYQRLGSLRELVPGVPIQAFTATATEDVREDVVRALKLREPALLIANCDRPNLTYRVLPRAKVHDQVMGVIERHSGDAGIVYCLSRKETERINEGLKRAGVRSAAYHAGLAASVRARVQEKFQAEDLDVVVATVAFGMGIDRTNVRFIVHASMPKGIEQYAQETGRAGRDGLPAECVLFYAGKDYFSWKGMLERSFQEAATAAAYAPEPDPVPGLGDEPFWGSMAEEGGGDDEQWFEGCEDGASMAQAAAPVPVPVVDLAAQKAAAEEAAEEAAFRAAKAQTVAVDRLGRIMNFATGGLCRHRALVEYFGQSLGNPGEDFNCGACDICLGELGTVEGGKVIAQKILSCIVRTGQRYGASYVADVCRGANVANIRKRGHQSLSTYGLLKDFDQRTLRSFIDQLVGLGFVQIAKGEYPTLYLSEQGGELMYGNLDVTLIDVPVAKASSTSGEGSSTRKRSRATKPVVELDAECEALFERLREFRRELARTRGVPPYVIFADRTLIAMANTPPTNLEEFGNLPGVGAKKLEDLGPLFLEELG
ncbi:MAG: RecQ family ATP-dependent DNA helicase, partial [Planctomycetota bacterium]